MIQEQLNIKKDCTDERPMAHGLTLIAYSKDKAPEELLNMVRSVWEVVAKWGRWCDEELGDWPTTEECVNSLPIFFQSSLRSFPKNGIENWLSDLHDREWIWWASTTIESGIKIDYTSESMPITTWTLESVVNISGGIVIYNDFWINSKKSVDLLNRYRESLIEPD